MKSRFWKKTLAAALALLIVSGAVPVQPVSQLFERTAVVTAKADDSTSATSGACGDNATWEVVDTDNDGTFDKLVISGSGEMTAGVSFPSADNWGWHNYRNNITAIEIENGITSIGNQAFSGCANLMSVTISDNVTHIDGYSFDGCKKLTSVNIPDKVTTINNFAFFNCPLTSVTIPMSVTTIYSGAFLCNSAVPVKDVYYAGTQEQWEGILNGKVFPDSATVHCQQSGGNNSNTGNSITYLNENGQTATTEATPLTGTETSLAAGTYVVTKNITYNSGLELNGDIKLILADNTEMSVNGGLTCLNNNPTYDISVYAQSAGDNSGKLTVKNQSGDAIRCKNYKQYGGNVTAETSGEEKGCISALDITISGGTVTANIEAKSATGLLAYGDITITGGTVTASSEAYFVDGLEAFANITITGGKVTANTTGAGSYGIVSTQKITISLSGDDDFIKASNYYSGAYSISVAQGAVLYTTEKALTGTISTEDIDGKKITKNDPYVSVSYVDENGEDKTTTAFALTGTETELPAGTYAVTKNISYTNGLTLDGDIKLILADNTEMSVNVGLSGSNGGFMHDISVYAQSTGDNAGKLTVKNQNDHAIFCEKYKQYGGNVTAETSGEIIGCIATIEDLTISGGSLTANTEAANAIALCADKKLTITGGEVTATAKGTQSVGFYVSGDLIISGGTVSANTEATHANGFNITGNLTITGGEVTAAIKGTKSLGLCVNGNVNISGGTVMATTPDYESIWVTGDINISGGKVTATAAGAHSYGIQSRKKITLSLSGDDDFIKASSYRSDENSISVAQGATLYTTENVLTGTLSAADINGKTLTKNDPCVSVSYVGENGESKTARAVALTGTETELAAGTYVVNQDISYTKALKLNGDVKLILADGYTCTMTNNAAIIGDSNNSLTVFGQSKNTGKLQSEIKSTCISGVKDYAQYGGTVDLKSTNRRAFWGAEGGTFRLAGGTMNAVAVETSDQFVIFIDGSTDITGGTLNISSTGNENDIVSCGIYCNGEVNISGGNININMEKLFFGCGIRSENGNINISGGTVEVNIKESTCGYGLYSNKYDIKISGGTVNMDVTTPTGYESFGMWALNDVTIIGGQITAVGKTAGIGAENVSIGFSKGADSLYANSYSIKNGGKIEVAEGQTITDGIHDYTGNLDKTAIAGKTLRLKSYTVTWKNADGTTLETDEYVLEGETPSYDGATPTKAATAQYSYTFSGWSDGTNTYAADALLTVSGNVTYTAQFNSTVKKYTVTWKNGDATLETDAGVPYGTMPEYNGTTPTKAADSQYTYTFSGWDKEISNVTEDVTYTAQFTRHTKYVAPSYYSQTWTMTMKDYEYDGTAHIPTINGTAHTYSYTEVKYTYYNTDTGEELDGAPSAVGNYRVEVYADGGPSYWSRTQYATYSITDPIDANGMAKVDAFKENDTVPVSNGKIFAGWFTDETCTTAYTENTGKAYAKFIDENILTVKAQISSGTTVNSASTSIRFITSLDSLKYQNIGFKITFNGKTIEQKLTKVYSSLLANGKKVNPAVFSEESHYMGAFTLNGIPSSAFGKEFTVTPYYTTQDGTIVEGATNTFTIASMISK